MNGQAKPILNFQLRFLWRNLIVHQLKQVNMSIMFHISSFHILFSVNFGILDEDRNKNHINWNAARKERQFECWVNVSFGNRRKFLKTHVSMKNGKNLHLSCDKLVLRYPIIPANIPYVNNSCMRDNPAHSDKTPPMENMTWYNSMKCKFHYQCLCLYLYIYRYI